MFPPGVFITAASMAAFHAVCQISSCVSRGYTQRVLHHCANVAEQGAAPNGSPAFGFGCVSSDSFILFPFVSRGRAAVGELGR